MMVAVWQVIKSKTHSMGTSTQAAPFLFSRPIITGHYNLYTYKKPLKTDLHIHYMQQMSG